jgi:hypothetical protein
MTRLLTLLSLCATIALAVPFADPNADPMYVLTSSLVSYLEAWFVDMKKPSTTAFSRPSQTPSAASTLGRAENLPLDPAYNHPGHPGMGWSSKAKPAVAGPGATQTQILTMIVQGPTVTITEQIIVATQAEFCIQATEAPHGPQGGKPPLPDPHPELLPSRPTEAERALEEAKRRKEKERVKVV